MENIGDFTTRKSTNITSANSKQPRQKPNNGKSDRHFEKKEDQMVISLEII